nr:MAG TPA_asm: hypothetical protein [Caudoviricetes sp.]
MAKIKRKVEMTLPELIEWGFKNNIRNREFVCNQASYKSVIFNLNGWSEFSGEYSYLPQDIFTVEIEEEITEDTIFPSLLKIFEKEDNKTSACVYRDTSISSSESKNRTLTYYLINNDGTLTLIWKDGELVGDE